MEDIKVQLQQQIYQWLVDNHENSKKLDWFASVRFPVKEVK